MKIIIHTILVFSILLNTQTMNAQCWKTVQSGANHCIGIKEDGTLWTWGANNNGQLGNGNTIDVWQPSKIGIDTTWDKVATGRSSNHNLAIKKDGTLWAWGYNFYAQCGNNDDVDLHTPLQIGTATDWKEVTCGMFFSLAIKTDGSLWGWGSNAWGQLNDVNTINVKLVPTSISSGNNWAQIAAGDAHTMALTNTGELFSCGSNTFGQIGNGNNTHQKNFVQIGLGNTYKSIAGGDGHSLAVRTDGTLWSWGQNLNGELGLGSTTYYNIPTQVGALTDWAKVATGEFFSFGIKTDSTLWAWGENGYGQLGIGNSTQQLSPVQVGNAKNWLSVQGGREHSVVMNAEGRIYTSGRNTYGALGNNANVHSNSHIYLACTPTQVSDMDSDRLLNVYPNPSEGNYKLTFKKSNTDKYELQIFDIKGELIQTRLYDKQENSTIDISNQARGVYFLKVKSKTTNNVVRLLKL